MPPTLSFVPNFKSLAMAFIGLCFLSISYALLLTGEPVPYSEGSLSEPSARRLAGSWRQGDHLALFGGVGVDAFGDEEMLLNDLW